MDIAEIDVVQPHGTSVVVSKSETKIQFSKDAPVQDNYFVACKPSLNSSGEGSFWKVTIDTMPDHICLFLGIIGNLNASSESFGDSTAYGWDTYSIWKNGICGNSHMIDFSQGECVHFHLKSNKLTMFCVKQNQKEVIDMVIISDAYYIHFSFYGVGTKISLEPLDEVEQKRMLEIETIDTLNI